MKDSSSAGAHTGASSDQDPDTGDRGDRGYREERDRRYREHRDRGYREDKDRVYREDKDRVYREDKDRGYREEADRGYREDLDSRGEGDSREERELTSSSLPVAAGWSVLASLQSLGRRGAWPEVSQQLYLPYF